MVPAQGSTSDPTLADLDEFALIDRIVERFDQGGHVLVGPGDDAAVVRSTAGEIVVSTDVLVEGRHFRRDWCGAADIGHRAAAQSLSDLNAMGARTTALTVGVTAPGHLAVSWLVELAGGLAEEAATVGASVVGGDLTAGELLVLSVTAVGELDGAALLRSGARPGDVVAITGRQGWAAAGLAVLSRGFRSPRAAVEAYRRPDVPYAAGAEARAAGATAAIDVSDGLLADLGHLAGASAVAVDLRSAALLVQEPLLSVGAALRLDPMSFVLTGGDDHPLVGTFPPGAELPASWRVVGSVAAGTGVTVDGAPYAGETGGYRHF